MGLQNTLIGLCEEYSRRTQCEFRDFGFDELHVTDCFERFAYGQLIFLSTFSKQNLNFEIWEQIPLPEKS